MHILGDQRRLMLTRTRLTCTVAALVYAGAAYAQGNSAEARTLALNKQLLQLHGQFTRAASASQQGQLRSQASPIIAARYAALRELMASNPAAAEKYVYSENVLADLASFFYDSASNLESRGTW